jgi:sterol desaturase/sphingolipid hydroxylase (fatty acid hydroxylase superfamily)
MESLTEIFIKLSLINVIRYFVIAGIPFILFYLVFPKKFQRLKIQLKHAETKEFISEIFHSLQTTFIFIGISIVVLFTSISEYTQFYRYVHDFPIWWIPISLILAIVFHDTYFYWMHRMMHHKKIYRQVHLVHHKSTNPSPWASYSFHFLEAIIEGLVIVPILFLIPMHLYTVSIFITLSFMINVYGHLGFEIVPARFRNSIWFKILNTSVYHNMHHSHVQGNYSLYFRHWDRWMKTENKNYEPYFDKILEQRKSNANTTSSSADSNNRGTLSSAKKLLAAIILMVNIPFTDAQIEGKWKMEDREVIVEIYQQQGKYYCKVVDAGNFIENSILKTQDVFLFSDYKKTVPPNTSVAPLSIHIKTSRQRDMQSCFLMVN